MQKEMTAEQEQEWYRPRVIIDLKVVVNRGDVPIISGPCGEFEEVGCPGDHEGECPMKMKELTEENRELRERLSKLENS